MLALSVRPLPLALAGAGLLILALSMRGASADHISTAEMAVFRVINGLPEFLYKPLWLPMQLGNLVVGLLVGLGAAAMMRDLAIAIAVVVATIAKLVVERVVRDRMTAFRDVRQRPGTSEPGAVLRGDVPESGASFPSGHVILAAAIAVVVSTGLPAAWQWVSWVLVLTVAFGRVYVGAHNPLDVAAGLGAGMLIGGLLDVLLK
jgi:membrane-associated phospholipid phosphatase